MSILFNEMDKRYVEPGTPGAKRGKRGGWYVEEPSKEPIKDKKGDIGIKVNHPRFGKGTITNIDRTTYSIPMVTVKLDSGDEIVRSINEWKKEPAGKSATVSDLDMP